MFLQFNKKTLFSFRTRRPFLIFPAALVLRTDVAEETVKPR